uniref:Bm8209 n=1 Tax=Brugia malayi TaxID=6279 RepID=A0A1I9GEF8_BRUMA|nr:Bm8209 [Brugia malayi]
MLGSLDATKRILKCFTLIKYQQHFWMFCLRNNIFRVQATRRKRKLHSILMFCGGLLSKPIIKNVHCKDQLVTVRNYFLIRCCLFRIVSLSLFFTPLLITSPIAYFWSGFGELWWRWLLWMVQRSGPTFIKLGQWASTRRDIFTKSFCDRMSVLHTKTTSRPWYRSQHALDQLFGDSRWKDFVVSVETDPIGSGCIAEDTGKQNFAL